MKIQFKDQRLQYIVLSFLLGFVVLWIITPYGIGLNPDTTSYFRSAFNIANGNFSFEGGSHYAPLYPMVLSIFLSVGVSASQAAWIVSWLSISITSIFFVKIIQTIHPDRINSVFLAGLFFLLSGNFLDEISSVALTEGLFVCLLCIGSFYFLKYLNAFKLPYLVIGVLFFVLASNTRHIGIFLCMPVFFGILFYAHGNLLARFFRGSLAAVCILLPYIFWIAIHSNRSSYASGSSLGFYPIGTAHLISASGEISKWFFPEFINGKIRIALLFSILTLFLIIVAVFHKKRKAQPDVKVQFIGWVICSYLFILIASVLFLTKEIIFYGRYLVILFPFILIILIVEFHLVLNKNSGASWLKAFLAIMVFLTTIRTIEVAYDLSVQGAGYFTTKWRNSPTVIYLQNSAPDSVYFSNKANQFGVIFPDRNFEHLPRTEVYLRENRTYQNELQSMYQEVYDKCGRIVIFFESVQDKGLSSDILLIMNDERFIVVHKTSDGIILGVKNNRCN